MLSKSQIRSIQAEKHTTTFTTEVILDFDKDWNIAVSRLKRSGVDLAAIPIVAAPKEYKNVRT